MEVGRGDGLLTAERGVALLIRHADCQPTLFYDPVRQVVGAAHCGWRGLVRELYRQMVARMERDFGSRKEEIIVAIGPSLGPERAEFRDFKRLLPPSFWSFQVKPHYFDFWALAAWQLEEAGILPANLYLSHHCTSSEGSLFYSARGKGSLERHGSFICLK